MYKKNDPNPPLSHIEGLVSQHFTPGEAVPLEKVHSRFVVTQDDWWSYQALIDALPEACPCGRWGTSRAIGNISASPGNLKWRPLVADPTDPRYLSPLGSPRKRRVP